MSYRLADSFRSGSGRHLNVKSWYNIVAFTTKAPTATLIKTTATTDTWHWNLLPSGRTLNFLSSAHWFCQDLSFRRTFCLQFITDLPHFPCVPKDYTESFFHTYKSKDFGEDYKIWSSKKWNFLYYLLPIRKLQLWRHTGQVWFIFTPHSLGFIF